MISLITSSTTDPWIVIWYRSTFFSLSHQNIHRRGNCYNSYKCYTNVWESHIWCHKEFTGVITRYFSNELYAFVKDSSTQFNKCFCRHLNVIEPQQKCNGQRVRLEHVNRGVKPKTIKLVFVASPLSTQHLGERAKTGWFGIMIVCPSRTTCLSVDCSFSELGL